MSAPIDVLAVLDHMIDVIGYDLVDERKAVAELIERNRVRSLEIEHLRNVNFRLIQILSAIEMRCAPSDTLLEDGRVMRFVPPDPEFYWRELSAKVRSIREEIAKAQAQDAAALARVDGAT